MFTCGCSGNCPPGLCTGSTFESLELLWKLVAIEKERTKLASLCRCWGLVVPPQR